jgi:hypothetical protein
MSFPLMCDNCGLNLESSPVPDAHIRNCKRLYEKCKICEQLIAKTDSNNHFLLHFCKLCGEKLEGENHEEVCDEKVINCFYCSYELKRKEMFAHEFECGSQTVLCNCGIRVVKRYGSIHLSEKHNTEDEIHLKAFFEELHSEFPCKINETKLEAKQNEDIGINYVWTGKEVTEEDIIQQSILDEIERQERLQKLENNDDLQSILDEIERQERLNK